MNNLEIMKAFCVDVPSRYAMDKPFRIGDYVYATNGHIAGRIPVDLIPPEMLSRKPVVPPCDKVMRAPIGSPITIPIPPSKPPARECKECAGSGQCSCRCGDDHDCGYCDGVGKVPPKESPVSFSGIYVAAHYLRMLKDCGVSEVFRTGDLNRHPIYFKTGDVDGVLMQCAPDGEKIAEWGEKSHA